MPLIDDTTRGTDRRPPARLAWTLVAVGFCLLWLMIAVAVSLVPRAMQSPATATGARAVRRVQMDRLHYAQNLGANGAWTEAALAIQEVDPASLDTYDRHTYYRTGAQAMLKAGSPLAGAKLYEQFLSMGARVREQECQGCHQPSAVQPVVLTDLQRLQLGSDWTGALTKAKALRATRDRLRAEVKKQPEDARRRILLYHAERATGEKKRADQHAAKLAELDGKASGGG